MRVDAFDFELPETLIALRPSVPRDAARLLVVPPQPAILSDQTIADLRTHLRAGDALVLNDTRVLSAQLQGIRQRQGAQAKIQVTLLNRMAPDKWSAFARPLKRLQEGDQIDFGALTARIERRPDDVVLHFSASGHELDQHIRRIGQMPLPPYIASKRQQDDKDRTDYQTVYASHEGSVAAPTAGLHFTPSLLETLQRQGVEVHHLTLHVGAGTFLPVKTEDASSHQMHPEWGEITPQTADALNSVRSRGGRIVAVGTTSLRLLETAAKNGKIMPFSGETRIFMTPGHSFQTADMLLTNFHLPRSTLFMLVCAFAGMDRMKAAYAHAIRHNYRFYSYGDASLLYRADE